MCLYFIGLSQSILMGSHITEVNTCLLSALAWPLIFIKFQYTPPVKFGRMEAHTQKKKKEIPFLFINFLISWGFRHQAASCSRKRQHQQLIWLLPARIQGLALLAGGDAAQAIPHDARPWLLTTWNNFAHSNSAWDATGVWHRQVLCFSSLCSLPFSIQNSVWKVPCFPFCPHPC